MVEGNRYQELALMYHLFTRVNGQEALKVTYYPSLLVSDSNSYPQNSWKVYIKSAGTAIVNDPERYTYSYFFKSVVTN